MTTAAPQSSASRRAWPSCSGRSAAAAEACWQAATTKESAAGTGQRFRHASPPTRQRAIAALKANPGVSLTAVAKLAGVSRSTVANARSDLAAEARREARKLAKTAPTDRRERAQRFLRDTLAAGPKRVSDVEDAAEKAHVDPRALEQARADLGIVTSRGNAGGVQAVQWSLPG